MRIPDYIKKALERREKAAYAFIRNDSIISNFILKNNIDCEYIHLHCESLGCPEIANQETITAIMAKERETE